MKHSLKGLVACAVLAFPWAAQAQQHPTLGVYKGPGCVGVKALQGFVDWFGKKPAAVVDFLDFRSWDAMRTGVQWEMRCWKGQGYNVTFSVPMLVKDGSTLARGAAGEYDQHFAELARLLVEGGHGNAILRLGWEFNVAGTPWFAGDDPPNWVPYYRRIVAAMRSVPGQTFRFDWNFGMGTQRFPADAAYPGDDVVDIIGMDVYDMTWGSGMASEPGRWNNFETEKFGLNWHKAFAAAHHKPISFPEWGIGSQDKHGGGDDPYFITQFAAWMKANPPVYQNFWDYSTSDWNGLLSGGQFPQAAAAFLTTFK